MLLEEPAAQFHTETADSSYLSLQGNVVVQPLEGIQQRLAGVWNFAWAEKRERESNMCEADREEARGREQSPTTALLAKQQLGQCWCGRVATRYR